MNASKGFTLIETIFSTLFISLTVLAIVNLFPGAYLSVKKSEAQLQSDIIANSIIEEIRATRYQSLLKELDSGVPIDGDTDAEKELLADDRVLRAFQYEKSESPFQSKTLNGSKFLSRVYLYEIRDVDKKFVLGLRIQVSAFVGSTIFNLHYETYIHSVNP